MKAGTVKRLATGTLAVMVAVSMVGLGASTALAADDDAPVVAMEDSPISVPEGTPTTMSWMSTVPTPEGSDITVFQATSEVRATSASAVEAITSVPVPNAVEAGGGGTTGPDAGAWVVLVVAMALTGGLSLSAIVTRRRAHRHEPPPHS